MKIHHGFIFLLLVVLVTACSEEPIFQNQEENHLGLEEILDHMPFEQFNNYSHAVFKDANGKTFSYDLTINERVIDIFIGNKIYTTNQITFSYNTGFDFEMPQIEITALIDSLQDRGYTEVLNCSSTVFTSSIIVNPKLTIIPGESYLNTILNEEFSWMEESFENVYSNILIDENSQNNLQIFYQSPIGIIGFSDALNRSWILDGFE